MFEENLCKHNIHEVRCVVAFGFVRGKSNVCTRKIQMSLHVSVMPAVRSRAGMKSWNNIVPLLLPISSVPPLPFTSPLRSSITIFHTVNTKLSNPWFVPESERESIQDKQENWRYFWDFEESSHIPLDAARRESRRRILCKNVRVNYFFPSSTPGERDQAVSSDGWWTECHFFAIPILFQPFTTLSILWRNFLQPKNSEIPGQSVFVQNQSKLGLWQFLKKMKTRVSKNQLFFWKYTLEVSIIICA